MREAMRGFIPRHPRQRAVPLVVFALALAVTLGVWWGASEFVRTHHRQRLENERHRIDLALTNRMDSQIALLRNTAAMFVTQQSVTREEFHRYVAHIGISGRYEGMQGIGFASVIPAKDRPKVERQVREAGERNFRIFPPGNREAWAITMIEPRDPRNLRALGYDMGSDATRRAAMERAARDGSVAVTGRVRLVQETGADVQPGFLMYCPIFREGGAGNPETGRKRLVGFLYSPFRAKNFFGEIFQPERSHPMWVEIYDGSGISPDRLLFRDLPSPMHEGQDVATRTVGMAGHTWTVRYIPRPDLLASSGEPLVRWIPFIGLLLACLLAALSYGQVRTNDALVAQAEELRRREFAQSLLARAGEMLQKTQDVNQNLRSVASLAVPSFGDWCAVDVLEEDGSIHRAAVSHVDPAKVEVAEDLLRRYPTDPKAASGVAEVLRSGRPQLYREVSKESLAAAARDEEHARILEVLNFKSIIVVPMVSHERVIGAISFAWAESDLRYDADDLEIAMEIGARAAVAVENARLLERLEREVSVRAAAEAQVREMNEGLERMVQERTRELTISNHELEAFCYSVSHDLRAPLRSVDGFSKAVLEDYGECLDDDGRRYLERVRQAARRMDELITALLNLSRLTRAELHVQPVDLSEIAREVADEALRTAGDAPVDISIQPHLEAEADPRMVRIVFDNLIGNAVKFSAKSPEPHVEIGRKDDAYYVRDNGVGFNPAYSNKLFAPFERLHSAGQFPGTGIGLATVQRIVARHGGHVWAEGEEGKGATFYFTLS